MSRAREKLPQIGFWDADVSCPTHDALCLWAMDHADEVLKAVHPNQFGKPWSSDDVSWHGPSYARDPGAQAALDAFMREHPRPDPRVSHRLLEHVLYRESGYRSTQIVGYADVVLRVMTPFITVDPAQEEQGERKLDIRTSWTEAGHLSVLIEAKTTMPTLGELMRQLNLYRTAFGPGTLVVLSSDDRHAAHLHQQGIRFLQYPGA